MTSLVSPQWLHANLNAPNLVLLDASITHSIHAPSHPNSVCTSTIPTARAFDLKRVFADSSSPFPNTIPPISTFEQACQQLGIHQDDQIVVFDREGIYSSPRVWWLFQVMGHQKVVVLDGGLPHWVAQGFPTQNRINSSYPIGDFKAVFQTELLVTFQQIKGNIQTQDFTVVDARSSARFDGTQPEPRAHLKSGHIPNSINIPYQEVLKNGCYQAPDMLNAYFVDKCQGATNLVFSCGSGMTACIVMLACQISYTNSPKLYDGSWTEWAERNHLTTIIES